MKHISFKDWNKLSWTEKTSLCENKEVPFESWNCDREGNTTVTMHFPKSK